MVHIDRNEAAAAVGEQKPVRNNAQGWGVATFITLLALALVIGAWWLHTETYHDPADPAAAAATGAAGH